MKDFVRFPLLLTITSLIEIFLTLAFPSTFYFVLASSIIISTAVFIVFFKKKQITFAVLFAFILLFSAINPYRVYISKEKQAEKLILSFNEAEAVFSAKVTDCNHYSSYSILYADIYSANGKKLAKTYPARISSYTASSIADGDYIEFSGKLQSVSKIDDDTFDTATYLRGKNCFIDVPSAEITRSSPSDSTSLLTNLRKFSKNLIYDYTRTKYDYSVPSVCYAMFAGNKDYLSSELKGAFTTSGTIHILCVSGMHLTVIAGALYLLLSLLSVHKKARCITVIAVCCLYSIFTGFSPSTVRACIMCIISFFALMTGKKADGYISLFFAAFIICTFSPYTILDISLILSFSACLGILAFSELSPSCIKNSKIPKALIRVAEALLINFGAVLFTLPISAYSFGALSHVSVPATLIASFPAQLLLTLLLIMHILSPLSMIFFMSPLFTVFGTAAKGLCSFIIKTAEFFSKTDYASTALDKQHGAIYLCIFAFLVLMLATFITFGIKRARFFICMAVICVGIIFSHLSLYKAIETTGDYSVSYFRQNENDRQLSIRLMDHGYLIVDADGTFCTDKNKADFDTKHGNNYLLLIPDEQITSEVLNENICNFDKQYGIAKIFIPETNEGKALAADLSEMGIKCFYMPEFIDFGSLDIEFSFEDFSRIKLNGKDSSTTIVFANEYNKEYFDSYCDTAVFLTRKTKNQFRPSQDILPECGIFFTRMKKDESMDKVINTFGKKHFIIKE